MKKYFFTATGFVFLIALSVININVTSSHSEETTLASLTLIPEACAECDWTNVFQGQGCTKDEREVQESCYAYENWYGGVSYGTASATAGYERTLVASRTDIRCAYGSTNCSRIYC